MTMVREVIWGMGGNQKPAPAKTEYKGETYYFCAPGCKVAFEKEPEKYLKAESETAHTGCGSCCCC